MDTSNQIKALLEDLQLTRRELHHANERIAQLLGRDTPLVLRLALMLSGTITAYEKLAAQTAGLRGGSRPVVIDEATALINEIRTGSAS